MFSCEFFDISKNTFFDRAPLVAALYLEKSILTWRLLAIWSRGVSRAAATSKMKYFGIIYPLHLGCCSSPISKKQFLNLKNNHLIVSHHKVLLCVENHSKPNEMEKQRKKSFKISAKTYHSLIRGVAPNPLMKKVRAKY